MENRNELSDIVLEKGDPKTLKVKRILILVAFLILVFLVALASMKLLHKDQNKDTSKLILPPEPSQETQIPKDDQLFKQVPIIEENTAKKESFEDMIKTLKEKEAQKQEEAKTADTPPPAKAVTPPLPQEKAPALTQQPVKAKEEPKKEATKPALKAPAATPASNGSHAAEPGIYVQVGAVATAPEQRVLSDIKSKGFDYRLYSTVVNGNHVTKILIGPYAKSSDAESALVLIRSSINKNAFIYRVK
jgi:DedD protein